MKLSPVATLVLSMTVLLAIRTAAGDKALKKSELPAAVQKVVEDQSRGATIRGYSSEVEAGVLQYEIEMTVGGHSRDVIVAADGRILEIEEEVAWDALPDPVRQGLQRAAANGKVQKVESLTKQGKLVAYEAGVLTGGKRSEVQVHPDGSPLVHH